MKKKYVFSALMLVIALCGACAKPQGGAGKIPLQNRKDLASSYVRSGDFIEALAEMAGAEKLFPGDKEIHLIKGIAYFGLKDFSSAEKSYEKALELDGSYTKARYTLCGLHLTMNKPDDAIRHCTAAAGDIAYPLRYAAMVNIARAYDMKGDPESAERFFKQSLLVERSNIYSMNEYGKFLANAARHSEAARHFSAALKLAPGHNEARMNLAESLMETGDAAPACAEIEQLLKNRPEPALEHRAQKYARRCELRSPARAP
ncbi:MAG: tetratricopeptide repeat protein [Candidatus Dadabacteria bacterium]|nr:tetratricopeptide repeat protein [Candidatus Dadabacteria bacterium]